MEDQNHYSSDPTLSLVQASLLHFSYDGLALCWTCQAELVMCPVRICPVREGSVSQSTLTK